MKPLIIKCIVAIWALWWGAGLTGASSVQAAAKKSKKPLRARIGLDPGMGISIPFSNFINVSGSKGTSVKADNGVGFAFDLSLLLDNFELRYAATGFSVGEIKSTIPPDTFSGDPNEPGLSQLVNELIKTSTAQTGDTEAWLWLHQMTFGYRFYFWDEGIFRPFIPLGGGFVAAVSEPEVLSMTRVGLVLQTGFCFDIKIYEWFYAGFFLRYNFTVIEAETAFSGVKLIAKEAINPIGDVVTIMHYLTSGARVLITY